MVLIVVVYSPLATQSAAPMDEFAEEHYSKGYQWQSQSSLVHFPTDHYASQEITLPVAFLH